MRRKKQDRYEAVAEFHRMGTSAGSPRRISGCDAHNAQLNFCSDEEHVERVRDCVSNRLRPPRGLGPESGGSPGALWLRARERQNRFDRHRTPPRDRRLIDLRAQLVAGSFEHE